ncbi:MAG: ferritin-like fold-containing protein [Galbitalea sp.]
MVNWFRRQRGRVEAPKLRPRSSGEVPSTKVDLVTLTPELVFFLGRSAYIQLASFEDLSRVVRSAPTTEAKSALSAVAGLALTKHQGLVAEIERLGEDPAEAMQPFVAEIDAFQRLTQGNDWYESVTSCYLITGFLDDFLARLAVGLPGAVGARVVPVLRADDGEQILAAELLAAIEQNPRLAARLAMWGRRLLGDTMLVARATLAPSDNRDSDEERIEPVFTELIAAHTRRMDALGLTA